MREVAHSRSSSAVPHGAGAALSRPPADGHLSLLVVCSPRPAVPRKAGGCFSKKRLIAGTAAPAGLYFAKTPEFLLCGERTLRGQGIMGRVAAGRWSIR